jgi:hypothetical protein
MAFAFAFMAIAFMAIAFAFTLAIKTVKKNFYSKYMPGIIIE